MPHSIWRVEPSTRLRLTDLIPDSNSEMLADDFFQDPIVTAYITESGSSLDTQNSSIKYAVITIIESASAITTQSSTYTTLSSITESTSVSSTQSSTYITSASQIENASSLDTITKTLKVYSEISESGSAIDTVSSKYITIADIVEEMDAQTGQNWIAWTWTVSIDENGNADDTVSSTKITSASQIESGTLLDNQSTTYIGRVSISEILSASDITDLHRTTYISQSESASAIDNISSVAIFVENIVESINALDGISCKYITPTEIIESALAQDFPNFYTSHIDASLSESGSAVDVVSATIMAIHLYNGIRLYHHLIPQTGDIMIKAGNNVVGIPTRLASNDKLGAVRINVSGSVIALKSVVP